MKKYSRPEFSEVVHTELKTQSFKHAWRLRVCQQVADRSSSRLVGSRGFNHHHTVQLTYGNRFQSTVAPQIRLHLLYMREAHNVRGIIERSWDNFQPLVQSVFSEIFIAAQRSQGGA